MVACEGAVVLSMGAGQDGCGVYAARVLQSSLDLVSTPWDDEYVTDVDETSGLILTTSHEGDEVFLRRLGRESPIARYQAGDTALPISVGFLTSNLVFLTTEERSAAVVLDVSELAPVAVVDLPDAECDSLLTFAGDASWIACDWPSGTARRWMLDLPPR